VKGDYNSTLGQWVPAAIVGDAVTLQSKGWVDAKPVCTNYQKGKATLSQACPGGFTMNQAQPTTVSAAILAGHQSTPCYHADPGCSGGSGDGSYYKGGGPADLLAAVGEDWTNLITIAYQGSLVSLHEGQPGGNGRGLYAKGKWAQQYYTSPQRVNLFDIRFLDPVNLPPATPAVGNVIQTSFRPVY
jgi:hypothetical protein